MRGLDVLSAAASFATLILFVIYFVGRIITIFAVKSIWKDKVLVDESRYKDYGVIEDVILEDCATDGIAGILVSSEGIRDLKIYTVECKHELLEYHKGKCIFSLNFLNINEAIAICVPLGDLYPTLIIEYLTADYMKVKVEWKDNLKSGVFSETIHPKHTVRSFLYFLFR